MPSPSSAERSLPLIQHDDDDDMDYEPASEVNDELSEDYEDYEGETQDDEDDDDDDDEADEEGTEYLDAEEEITVEELIEELTAEGDGGETPRIEIETGPADHGDQEGAEQAAGAQPTGARPVPMTITRSELLQLLAQSGAFRRLWRAGPAPAAADDDEDEGDERQRRFGTRRRQRPKAPDDLPKVPSDQGRQLMESGNFGTNERLEGRYTRKKKLASRIMKRELGLESPGKQRSCNRLASQGLIPSSNADTIVHYDTRCYSGQFSEDGNFFFSCSQDFKVRMYDTSNPYNWRHYRTVSYPFGQWTITDASLSPDNKYLAYSSIKSIVCLAPTDPETSSEPFLLDFSDTGRRPGGFNGYSRSHFGIWSIRFSGDGREIVAGTSDNSVYVYDLETRQSVLRIHGHEEDVNAVCYGDKSSPHILYSGSDDTTLKVWDRRSLGDQREAGVFLGHTEGITYVDSKGDGRYVLSNGKDQTMKLWDLRKMVSTDKARSVDPSSFSTGFDYRFEEYRLAHRAHPHDCSIVTFRGHRVLKTLIRCHFSPPGSTDSRYVYTGSEDGSVYIYNMDATIAGRVDVEKATLNTRPRGNEDPDMYYFDDRRGGQNWKTCVRDASWHPNAPVIAATSWNGYGMMKGTCTVHTWNDGLDEDEAEPPMGQRVNAELKSDRRLYEAEPVRASGRMSSRTMRTRRTNIPDDDD